MRKNKTFFHTLDVKIDVQNILARALETKIARGLPARKCFPEWALRIYLE
jgi:hypothetical protein